LAADVASVMEHVRNEVERVRGVRLSTEIRMVGFDDAGGGA
jgi:UDP-N-acetylenolpyruvoylglucosamine reductase